MREINKCNQINHADYILQLQLYTISAVSLNKKAYKFLWLENFNIPD